MICKLTIICKWIRVDKEHGCLKLYCNEQSLLQFALSVRFKMEAKKKSHFFKCLQCFIRYLIAQPKYEC